MSCPSSRTRTPDNGRLLDLSFEDESVALMVMSIMGTWLRYGSSAQYSTYNWRLAKARDSAILPAKCPAGPSRPSIMIRKQKTAFFLSNCHGSGYVTVTNFDQSVRWSRFYVRFGYRLHISILYCTVLLRS
jgi:hypothetical protein